MPFPLSSPFAKAGGEGKHSQSRERKGGLKHLCLCSSPSLEALGGAEQLPDKICFPGVCRNSLALLEEQTQEVQQLRKEVACLAAEMSRVKKVILRFGKEGWDKQGPTQGAFLGLLVGFSRSLHPPIPYRGLLVELLRYKAPSSGPV